MMEKGYRYEGSESSLERYRILREEKPSLFENPDGCLTEILFEAYEIRQAQRAVRIERQAMNWPIEDLRVGLLAQDPYIGYVIRDAVRFADGKFGLYNRVVTDGGAAVLPVFTDGSVALIRIFRHAARRWFLEVPQGFVTANGDHAETARQEVIEEIGANVDELIALGNFYTNTALTSENLKMYAAKISSIGVPQRSEGIESIRTVAKAEIDALIADGTICDGPTMVLVLRARMCGLL